MEGSSEPAQVEIPLADTPMEEKKTGWTKYAIICFIAGAALWVLSVLLFIPTLLGVPFTGCCAGPLCGLGWLSMVLGVVFLILGIMKV